MRNLFLASILAAVVMSCGPATTLRAQRGAETAAQQAAESWLALVDAGKYRESWREAAQLFKDRVTSEQWESAVRAARTPLGKVGSRKLKIASYKKTLPGAPDGEYVVIQYETSFEKKRSAVETITPMKGDDGRWRVSGYYIK